MSSTVFSQQLCLRPVKRPEIIDLRNHVPGGLQAHRNWLCVSHHTTAGFLDPTLRRRMGEDSERLEAFVKALADLFPPEAGYAHDRLSLRDELSEAQKLVEPLNADAHLAFIGGGFTNCVVASPRPGEPIWFVDFDGVFLDRYEQLNQRTRTATVVGFEQEITVARVDLTLPDVREGQVVRLDDPALGIVEAIEGEIHRRDIQAGLIRLDLEHPRRGEGLTMNEFEALLMERDMRRILSNPFNFAREGTRGLRLALEALGVTPRRLSRLLARLLGAPEPQLLRLQRSLAIAILPEGGLGGPSPVVTAGRPLMGTYQSPLLVQRPAGRARVLRVTFSQLA
jgi:thiamine phosphate synthase YjbQ (UPF0047 family)